jgi:hypothetical protein
VKHFELYRSAHPHGRMTALTVVEYLQVVEDRVSQLDPGLPSLPVEEFGLHSAPEGFDDGVVVTLTG